MKLSEAIVLGSTMINLNPGTWYLQSKGCGCLIGMGYVAAGGRRSFPLSADLIEAFPWLEIPLTNEQIPQLPEIILDGSGYESDTPIAIISKMAVLVHEKKMTFEQAIDWIRSVEPAEEPAETVEEWLTKDRVNV